MSVKVNDEVRRMNKIKKGLEVSDLKSYILICLGILAVLPFLILSLFNHPQTDDFCTGISILAVQGTLLQSFLHK